MHKKPILILDFGSQYTQLIARRCRELGVFCFIEPWDISEEKLKAIAPQGIIFSGGPKSVSEKNAPVISNALLEIDCPKLGVCYGMQTLVQQLGGHVQHRGTGEYGYAEVIVEQDSLLFQDIAFTKEDYLLEVWMSHGDEVVSLPSDFQILAKTKQGMIAAIANTNKNLYGLQFHPEVTHTKNGVKIIENFIVNICRAPRTWQVGAIASILIKDIKRQVGQDRVLLGLSGGVDSTVLSVLLKEAIGDQLTCMFVDNGLLRKDETVEVHKKLTELLGLNVHVINAKEEFLQALIGISDPEEKRKTIGNTFIEVFEREAKKLGSMAYLAQGTIYPDVIESAKSKTNKAHVIKSHHNVGGLPEKLNFKLLEPFRKLFKDEVRRLGTYLGIPDDLIQRHPFPGPGLAVRMLGEIKAEHLEILKEADNIFVRLLKKYDYYNKVSQAFAVFLPIKSVGVKGDCRAYEYVIGLRAVETTDFMTARWARLPYELLEEASHMIINSVKHISRVVYDISGKPPATIEWE